MACAFAQDHVQLGILGLLAGFGLGGGCLSTAIAMVAEFSRGRVGRASTTAMTGYRVGAVSTAPLGLIVLPTLEWKAMFVIGTVPGFVLVSLMLRFCCNRRLS